MNTLRYRVLCYFEIWPQRLNNRFPWNTTARYPPNAFSVLWFKCPLDFSWVF